MKKILAMLMTCVMVFSLAACSSNEKESSSETTQTEAAETTETEEETAESNEAAAEDITIEYWYQNSNYEEWITTMAEAFHEENPNITIVPVIYGDDQALSSSLVAAFQEKNAPTLFHTRVNSSFADYSSGGFLEDLSEYGIQDMLTEAGVEAGTAGDGFYAAPIGYSAFCVIYNTEIFEELGLTAPNNFEEMVEVVNACKEAGYGGIAYPGGDAGHLWISRNFFRTAMTTAAYNAFELGIDDGSVTDISEYPDAVAAIKSMAALYENEMLYNGSEQMKGDNEMTLFANGDCAMMVHYTGSMLSQEALADMNMGIFPLYSESGDGSYYAEINNMISMYAGASDEEKAAGIKFIQFLLEEDNMAYYAGKQGEVVAVEGVVAEHKYGELFQQEFDGRGITMRTLCITSNSDMWQNEYNAMLLGLIFNGYDADEQVAQFSEHLKSVDIASLN